MTALTLSSALRSWADFVASGYEVPAASKTMIDAAIALDAKDVEITRLTQENERMREALVDLHEAVMDGLCNSGIPDFDAGRLDRALDAAQATFTPDPAGGMPVEVKT